MNCSSISLSQLTNIPRDQFFNELFERYAQRLLRAAETHLDWRLRSKVGTEDVVQSAFKSFYRCMNSFQFDDGNSEAIWALLVVITIRKCRKWDTFFRADKRSVRREADSSAQPMEFVAESCGNNLPEDLLIVSELVSQLLSGFDERRRAMIRMRIEGYELNEIADLCNSSRRTVARTIAEAKLVLSEILQTDVDNEATMKAAVHG